MTRLPLHAGSSSNEQATESEQQHQASEQQPHQACVVCVWNNCNALRLQHGLTVKDLHISLAVGGTNLGQHSLSMLLPESPFKLDEQKLIQASFKKAADLFISQFTCLQSVL